MGIVLCGLLKDSSFLLCLALYGGVDEWSLL